GATERVLNLLDTQRRIESEAEFNKPPLINAPSITVTFDKVGFAYNDGGKVLDDVSFVAEAGKVTALVGPSGGGKTTILNLIPRFYDVSEGAIKMNGQDIRNVSLNSLRDKIALVSQDIVIFSDTVMANISY